MDYLEPLLVAISLSMDAFAVSTSKGLCVKKASLRQMATCGIWFGGFQALMPLLGYLLGTLFKDAIERYDHWVAFGLLALIGINMLREALSKEEEEKCDASGNDFGVKTMFVMAVATSIDAMAIGVGLAMAGDVNIWVAIAFIGVITCLMSALGVKIGNVFGSRYEKKAEAAGGIILILLGAKILLEHLGILG